jgi:hypothetical protein
MDHPVYLSIIYRTQVIANSITEGNERGVWPVACMRDEKYNILVCRPEGKTRGGSSIRAAALMDDLLLVETIWET